MIEQTITNNPGLTDAQVADAVNAVVEYRRVPIEEINLFLIDRFLNGRLRLARDNPQMPNAVRAFLGDFLIGTQTAKSVDGTSPTIRGAIAQVVAVLVQAQVMLQEEADAFNAILVAPREPVTEADVARARRAMAVEPEMSAAHESHVAFVAAFNTFVANRDTWVFTGAGAMPTWGGAQ